MAAARGAKTGKIIAVVAKFEVTSVKKLITATKTKVITNKGRKSS